MLIRVDFPAPFSPSRHKTSPGIASRLMRSLATTPGKAFVISMSSTAGTAAPTGGGGTADPALRASGTVPPSRTVMEGLLARDERVDLGLGIGRRHSDRAIGDGCLGGLDGRGGLRREVIGLQQRHAAVAHVLDVALVAEGPGVDVLDRLRERRAE